jgi:hypothetical protein
VKNKKEIRQGSLPISTKGAEDLAIQIVELTDCQSAVHGLD